MFLLHCLALPCCGTVTSSEILVADYSKKLKDFGSSNFSLFSSRCFPRSPKCLSQRLVPPRNNPKFLSPLSSTLVGRIGFEPRQSVPKALNLPLVDRPIHRRILSYLTIVPARSLCEF